MNDGIGEWLAPAATMSERLACRYHIRVIETGYVLKGFGDMLNAKVTCDDLNYDAAKNVFPMVNNFEVWDREQRAVVYPPQS